jgi:hypothetical protein
MIWQWRLEIPSTKTQAPKKFQFPRFNPQGATVWAAVDFECDGWEAVTP